MINNETMPSVYIDPPDSIKEKLIEAGWSKIRENFFVNPIVDIDFIKKSLSTYDTTHLK